MKGSPEKDLEIRLSNWADSRKSRLEQLVTLEQRIRADWAACSEKTLQAARETPSLNSHRPLLARTIAAAATAAVIWLAIGIVRPPKPVVAGVPWEEQVRQQSEVLSRYHDLFGDQLAWLVESGDGSDLGITPNASPTQAYVAIRLRLTARSQGDTEWRVVQTFNVIAAGETTVEVPADEGGKTHLSLWAYPLDARVIAIDLRYQPEYVPGAVIEASVAQVEGVAQTVSEFSQGGVEYRLLQTAQQIHAGVPKDRTS